MCPAVKKQLLNLYAAFGFKPTKDIIVPGYKPVPPEGGGPIPPSPEIEAAVRDTTITVKDADGRKTEMSVQDLFQMMFTDYLTGYIKDTDSDGNPDDGAIYLEPVKKH